MKQKETISTVKKFLLSWEMLVVLAVALGTFLRFYRIEENLVFHGELGHNYLAIKNFLAQGKIPLLGPPTSHPWLSFGPLFYWIMTPILSLFKFDPRAGAYFFALLGSLVIIINYEVIQSLFKKKVAAISSYLLAISPLWLIFSRESRFFFLAAVFFYPFIWCFSKALENKKKGKKVRLQQTYLFWAGIFLGVMLNFHLTPLVLIPAAATIVWLKKNTVHKNSLVKGIIGVFIPNIPFMLNGFNDRFTMLFKLVAWIPYRLAGFIGLYPKNTVSLEVLKSNLTSLNNFFVGSFVFQKSSIFVIVTSLILLTVTYTAVKAFKTTKNKDMSLMILSVIFIWAVVALFLHGDPPRHYYVTILPLPIIFVSILSSKLTGSKLGIKILVVLLASITLINLKFLFSQKWFFGPERIWFGEGSVPFSLQVEVSRYIIKDAQGKPFKLKRVGEFDHFDGDYAQNYQYLLWWMGNEPEVESQRSYIIFEEGSRVPNLIGSQDKIFFINNIAVMRKINTALLKQ